MRNTLAIAGKDARVYLTTWTSYILFGCFTLITAVFFLQLVRDYQIYYLQAGQSPQGAAMLEQMNLTDLVMGNVFRNIEVFFLFFLPILTMRLLAEERKGKTLELLMTSPVRPVEIVLGKYLAALLIMGIMLALTIVFPILLQIYGSTAGGKSPLDWGTILVGYFGLFMLGGAFVGVGLFASSVSESQIISVILSFALLLIFFIIGYAARGQEGFARVLLENLSLTKHVEGFVKGIINIQAVVYYVSLAFLGLFLTYRVVEAQRWR